MAYPQPCQAQHSRETLCGYVVRETNMRTPRTWRDYAVVLSPRAYGTAIEIVRELRQRDEPGAWGVVDTVHECGCRFFG